MHWGKDTADATPLTEEQRNGLRLSWITTRAELDDAETDNILAGTQKWRQHRRRLSLQNLLDDKSVRDLHRDMFGDVWAWAGKYRTEDPNIGVEPWNVAVKVRDLGQDAAYWFATGSTISIDTAATKFHHRMVQIHPFANGNGRHARELTDLILLTMGAAQFTWGSNNLGPVSGTRLTYVRALQAADDGDFAELLSFVRS
ncbi:MAG: mobile mystery protein B [Nakamurella sp.]